MENRNKYITIAIVVVLALAIGFAALYFSGFLTNKNKNQTPGVQLTEQQKMDILTQVSTSTTPINTPPAQKQNILNNTQTNTKPTTGLTNEERLKILNQAQ